MIILDTNVLSALTAENPDPEIARWLDLQAPDSVWITAVTVLEVHFGIELLPHGRRRSSLEERCAILIDRVLEGRVLAFDRESAVGAARCAARRRTAGRPMDFRDAEIAGIAASRRATLATRNTRDFHGLGIDLVDPWQR